MNFSAIAARCAIVLTGALLSVGCAGLVVEGSPDGGEGGSSSSSGGRGGPPSSSGATGGSSSGGVSSSSSSGVSGSSSGVAPPPPPAVDGGAPPPVCSGPLPSICQTCSDGKTECAHFVIANGECQVEICPPSAPPVDCAPGNPCQAGVGCATATTGGSNLCTYNCQCGAKGVFVCTTQCPDAGPPPNSCSQGALCSQGSGCGSGSPGGCTSSCFCDSTGHMQCSTSCPPVDAGCVETELCILGDHWDPAACRCVPDVPGACCPANWDMYTCAEADGGLGFACHNPALGCPSSMTCGGGCDTQVTGVCPTCAPIPCPPNEKFDANQCACVETCNTASDCTGPVPLFCQVCGDGGFGCAHWSCNGGLCEIASCQ